MSFFSNLFHTFVYDPLYNGLVFLIDLLPFADVGVVIILFTIIVKLILFPLSQKAVRTQIQTKAIQPEIEKIKEKYKEDRQKQAEEMLALYREKGINPFSGILLLLIQIPIIFALYFIFLRGGLPNINLDLLYSFVPVPEDISVVFLGLIDVTKKSIVVSVIVALSQYLQVRYSDPLKGTAKKSGAKRTFQDDLARSMGFQLKYVLPIIIGVVSYTLSVAVSLYWITNNLFTIGQEMYTRRKILKEAEANGGKN
jgi:YidC/Oxa1 family membrane protein insertase